MREAISRMYTNVEPTTRKNSADVLEKDRRHKRKMGQTSHFVLFSILPVYNSCVCFLEKMISIYYFYFLYLLLVQEYYMNMLSL